MMTDFINFCRFAPNRLAILLFSKFFCLCAGCRRLGAVNRPRRFSVKDGNDTVSLADVEGCVSCENRSTPMPTTHASAITPEVFKEHGITPEEYERIKASLGREPSLTEL